MANKNVIWCDPKNLEKDLSGKTYIVTGANSGIGFETTQQLIKDGFEITMAASFYGHFLLSESLLDTMKKTEGSRMVILSSVVHAGSPDNRYQLHFEDLEWKTRPYNNFAAYGEAKVASVLYAKELAER